MTSERLIETEGSPQSSRQTFSAPAGTAVRVEQAYIQVQAPQLTRCLTLNKSPNLLQPLFPHLLNRNDNSICHHREVKKIIFDDGYNGSSFISQHFLPYVFPSGNTNLLVASPHMPFSTPHLHSCTPFSPSNALFPEASSYYPVQPSLGRS